MSSLIGQNRLDYTVLATFFATLKKTEKTGEPSYQREGLLEGIAMSILHAASKIVNRKPSVRNACKSFIMAHYHGRRTLL